jgi:hypothetical protein
VSDVRMGHLLQRGLLGVTAWPSSYLRRLGNRRSIEGGDLLTTVVLTKVDPREPSLASGPSSSDWSCRGLPTPPIGSCRAGSFIGLGPALVAFWGCGCDALRVQIVKRDM